MATIWEETKTQTAKMKGRPLKEKLAYFWEYYRTTTLIVVGSAALLIALIHAIVTSKDYALSVIVINSITDEMTDVNTTSTATTGSDAALSDVWINDLSSLITFDPKEYEIFIDTSMSLGTNTATANAEYANQQKLAAMMSAQTIDILVANTKVFEQYAQNEYYYDLREIYSAEEIQKFSDAGLIYYTDASTYADYDDTNLDVFEDQASYTVNHHAPDSIKEPVPVGFFLNESTRIGAAGIYSYLTTQDVYQGYPEEGVMGIPVNTPRVDNAKTAASYFLDLQ